MAKRVKRDKWTDIVKGLNLDLTQPLSNVTANDIKRISKEEPRLMAYIDREKLLPDIFQQHGVFLLPISRTEYVIVHGKGFHELEPIKGKPQRIPARYPFEMTMLAYGSGESRHLLSAYHSGLLHRFTGISGMFPTALGKMGTESFSFSVGDGPIINVENAGMEIDIGFEGSRDVLLFEGKARARETFLIRQLYYPYRAISGITEKDVRPFFFIADPKDESYNIWEYSFTNPGDYESIRLVKSGSFILEKVDPPMEELESVEPDPSLGTIPQADDFQKVADFPLKVHSGIVTARQWAESYRISERQGSYYREATEAMGLVKSEEGRYVLTNEGKRYIKTDPQERADFLAGQLLKIPVINTIFNRVKRSPKGVGREEIASIIARASHLSGSTPRRRASTVLSWFRWMARTTGAFVVKGGRIYARPTSLDDFAF